MLEITNKTKRKLTTGEVFLFKKVTEKVLGKKYDLSLVICTDKISDHNVLAYPLSETEGEIFLNPSRRGTYTLGYLFIHACGHLKGLDHSPAMDKFENKIYNMYK